MKKIVFAFIALAVIFGAVTIAKAQDREKISSPTEIKHFSDIIKHGLELWGKHNTSEKEPILIRPETVTCVSAAIDKKDAALKAGNTSEADTQNLTIDARNSCQKAALGRTVAKEQRTANQICLQAFRKSTQENLAAFKKSREEIWKTYSTDIKACGMTQKAAGGSADISVEDGQHDADSMK